MKWPSVGLALLALVFTLLLIVIAEDIRVISESVASCVEEAPAQLQRHEVLRIFARVAR